MTTIKKIQLDYSFFNAPGITDEAEQINTAPITVWVDVKPDTFEIKMHRTVNEINEILLWHKIELSELTKKPGFGSQTAWFVDPEFNSTSTEAGETIVSNIKEYQIVDMFAQTIVSKPALLTKNNTLYVIFVPDSYDTAGMESFQYRISMDSSKQYIFEGPSAGDFVNENVMVKDMISNITLSSDSTTLAVDSSIVINVASAPFIKEVYLEQVSGLLNKTRVKLTNGQGSFTLFSTGLDSGETARVKVGHRKFTGVSDFSIIVS